MKSTIAIFSGNWLGTSETFIYRQLKGIEMQYDPVVLSERQVPNETSAFANVHFCSRSKVSFIWASLARRMHLPGNCYGASRAQLRYWKQVVKSPRPALLYAHYGFSGLKILPLVRQLRIPLVTAFHGNDASSWLKKRGSIQSLRHLFQYSHIVTDSDLIRDRLRHLGADPARTHTHYIGTSMDQFPFVERGPVASKCANGAVVTFLQVSNFVEKKGHPTTIRAFATACRARSNIKLILGGEGPLRFACESLAQELGVSDRITFLGRVSPDDVFSLMAQADVFLHHSVTGKDGSEEGIPTVVMEAMSTGLPVITTYHAGIPELVESGYNGYLVRERDHTGYVQQIERVLSESEREVPKRARAAVESNFDLQRQNERLCRLFADVIAAESAGKIRPSTFPR